jgi:hypothetical protein
MSKILHTVRLHLLCATEDVETVRAALAKTLPDWLTFAPIPDEPGLYVDSGQWTPEQAARLTEACEGLPVKVWRGVALAYSEPGVVVDKGGDASRVGDLRLTMAKAAEEFKATVTPLEKKR